MQLSLLVAQQDVQIFYDALYSLVLVDEPSVSALSATYSVVNYELYYSYWFSYCS